eukprot:6200975-Pleurochrysis_carterae.AAC.2
MASGGGSSLGPRATSGGANLVDNGMALTALQMVPTMGKIWEQIRKSPMNSVDSFGYLGKGTKLADYVIDMVPVELSTKSGASIWRNKGSSSAPKYQRMWAYGVEFYLFTAYYGWPTMLAGTPCTGGKISVRPRTCIDQIGGVAG